MPGAKRCLRLVLFSLLAALLPAPLAALPAVPAGGYTGIDLSLLIDQSGSMWGYFPDHPEKNDRSNHRIGAAQEIVLRLLNDVWKTSTVHRFSVIDFADEAEVVWSNQALRYDPKDPEALGRGVKSQLSRRIRGRTGPGWINTNTPLALELGRQELTRMAAGDPRTGRRRIVLVITDGRANKPPASLITMRDRVAAEARRLKAEGIELWGIGLNDHDYYWNDGDGAFWESLTGMGRAPLAERASTSLPAVVGTTVDEWLGKKGVTVAPPPSSTAPKDQYVCPPYLSRLTFRATASIPYGKIRILDPDGLEVPRTAGGPMVPPGTFTHFTIDDPKPGVYRIEKDTDRSFAVAAEEVPPQVERVLPAGETDLGAETRVVFRATKASGQPLAPLKKWPIRASVRITPPSGPPLEIPAESKDDGRFEAVWKPTVPGVYRTELRGLVRLEDGTERDIFQAGPTAYSRELTVSRRRPLYLELDAPRPAAGLRLAPWARSAEIELSLHEAAGERITDLPKRVKEPATWLSLVPIDASGVALGAPVPLVPAADGTFSGRIPVTFGWKDLDLPSRLGSIYFKVQAKPGRMNGEEYLNSIRLPTDVEDRRVAGDPMTVGPLDVRLPRWLLLLGLVPLLAPVAAGVWWGLFRAFPDRVISREDAARGAQVQLQIYDHMEGPGGVSALSLPVGGSRTFALDDRVSLSLISNAGDQRVVADRFRVTRLSSPRKARARLEYRWRGQRERYKTDLTTGSPKPLKGLPQEAGRMMVTLSESK